MMKEIRLDDPVQLHTTDSLRSSKAEFQEQVLYNPFNLMTCPIGANFAFVIHQWNSIKCFKRKTKQQKVFFFSFYYRFESK